jgi:Fe2+ or Zn2+ uptake regulation protein
MKDIEGLLRDHGIRPSYQRLRILACLAATKEHPSVDAIYRELAPELPTLSRTTVYNTLSLFVEAGVAQPIFIDGGELRYDADTGEHGHFRCKACGRVFDFPTPQGGGAPRLPHGFKAEFVQLYCVGLCKDCSSPRGKAEKGK